MVRYGGNYVQEKTDNSLQTLVTLAGYKVGFAPMLPVNSLHTWAIEYGDTGSANRRIADPHTKITLK